MEEVKEPERYQDISLSTNTSRKQKLPTPPNGKFHRELHKAIYYLKTFVEQQEKHKEEIADVVNTEIITHFKSLLALKQYPNIQHDVLWISINFALQYDTHTDKILMLFDTIFLNRYCDLLKTPSYAIKHHTLWILAIGAKTSLELRDKILSSTFDDISAIIKSEFDKNECTDYGELTQEYDKLMAITATVIYTFCDKGHHSKPQKQKLLNIIECLLFEYGVNYKVTFNIAHNDDSDTIEIQSQIVWSLYVLIMDENTNKNKEFLDLLCTENIIKDLIYFLFSNNDHIIDGSVRVFSCILKHDTIWDKYVSMCITFGLLPAIKHCMDKYIDEMQMKSLNKSQLAIIENICWLISKIAADSIKSAQLLVENDLFLDCIHLMESDDINIGQQVLIALSNAALHCNKELMDYLMDIDVMEILIEYGACCNYDYEIIGRILNCLECIFADKESTQQYIETFTSYGGVEFLQNIKDGATDEIFTLNEWKAINLLTLMQKYFVPPDDENNDWFAFDMQYVAMYSILQN